MPPRPPNDALHSQLRKGRAPAQRRIDDLPAGVGRTAYGRCRVLEIEAQAALTDFTMGGRTSGAAWSLNPYVGCLHACRFCYVPDTLHVERPRWGQYIIVKHNLASVLRHELRVRRPLTVYISTGTDAYQAVEADRSLTRDCLRLLVRRDWPVDVLTRSPLVTRDIDLLGRLSRVRVGLSVPTLDDQARRLLEPAAPPIGQGLAALRRLADAGLPVYANYAPAFPPTGGSGPDDVARAFRDAGAAWVNTSPWRRAAGFLGPLWDSLHGTEWEDLARFAASDERQRRLRRELDAAFGAAGVPLRSGFFNPPFDVAAPPPRQGAAEGDGSTLQLLASMPPSTTSTVPVT